jgi:outer membrane protein assembly factor BamB
MRKFILPVLTATVAAFAMWAADWPSLSGNPQREGWAKSEKAFNRENARNIELLYKFRVENQARGLSALTGPIVNGMLITYLGFKEMLVIGGSEDNVFAIDADLNRRIWNRHFEYKGNKPPVVPNAVCPGGLTAGLAMPGSSTAIARGPAPAPPPGRAGTPVAPIIPLAPGRGGLFATGFGRSGVFIAISSDGYMHPLNTSTGADKAPPVRFLPANSKVSALNINDSVIYAATQDGCGGNPNALYALDMSGDEPKLSTLPTNGAGAAGAGGTAIAADGTVFAQFPDGAGDIAGNYQDTVVALSKDLKVKDYFTPAEAPPPLPKDVAAPGITPVVFEWKSKTYVAVGSRNGRVYLLDAQSLGGADHNTPLVQSEPVAMPDLKYAGNGLQGTFSSWEDPETNTRWLYASLWGPPGPGAKGNAPNGSIVALRLVDRAGKPTLESAWVSRDMMAPAPTVTANGLVFALSSGESGREAKKNGKPYRVAALEKTASHATVYVLDGATGAELYSSGDMAAAFSHNSGLAVANRRIYFTTHDNTVFALGFIADQPQLTGK